MFWNQNSWKSWRCHSNSPPHRTKYRLHLSFQRLFGYFQPQIRFFFGSDLLGSQRFSQGSVGLLIGKSRSDGSCPTLWLSSAMGKPIRLSWEYSQNQKNQNLEDEPWKWFYLRVCHKEGSSSIRPSSCAWEPLQVFICGWSGDGFELLPLMFSWWRRPTFERADGRPGLWKVVVAFFPRFPVFHQCLLLKCWDWKHLNVHFVHENRD